MARGGEDGSVHLGVESADSNKARNADVPFRIWRFHRSYLVYIRTTTCVFGVHTGLIHVSPLLRRRGVCALCGSTRRGCGASGCDTGRCSAAMPTAPCCCGYTERRTWGGYSVQCRCGSGETAPRHSESMLVVAGVATTRKRFPSPRFHTESDD